MAGGGGESRIRRFLDQYRRVRLEEGFASADPRFARSLPFRDLTGRNRAIWRVRAMHYVVIRACLSLYRRARVLDLGAGNGWLARRLASSHRVTALDVDAGDTGLGALDDPRVGRLRAELEAVPVRDGAFDVVIAAAALHHAASVPGALAEIARVLRPRGLLVVADSPVYTDALARHEAWQRTRRYYADAGAAELAQHYRGLTRQELDGSGLFRFVTVAPGLTPWRALSRRAAREARMPVLLGWRRS